MSRVSGESLWSFCEDLVEKGAGYVWGAYGKIYNKAHANALYNAYHTAKYDKAYYLEKQWNRWKNKPVVDCSGMIQAFRIAHLDGVDDTANGLYQKCSVKGDIGTLPKNKRGVLLFVYSKSTKTMNHVGVYGGDGTTIESKDSATGVTHLRLDSRWTHWGIPDWINPKVISKTSLLGARIVTAVSLNVRAGNGSGYKIVRVLNKDTIVPIYEISGKWVKISKEKEEWVSSSYLKDAPSYKVLANSLNVRNKSNTSGKVMSTLNKNDIVYNFNTDPNVSWIKIDPVEERWISGSTSYVKKQ